MTRDWIRIAESLGVPLPANPERFVSALSALDAAFRPLIATIPLETEPAVILSEAAVKGEPTAPVGVQE